MTKALAIVAAVLVTSVPATAQEKITVSRAPEGYIVRVEDRLGVRTRLLPSVPHMLEDFVAGEVGPSRSSYFLTSVSASRDLFPIATVDSVADGLERLALTHRDERVGVAAIYSLGALGNTKGGLRRGNVDRLVRIYRVSNHRRRSTVVDVLGGAGESQAAATFLRSVAVGDATDPDGRLAEGAVFSLSVLGTEGVTTLRELHQRGLVKDPDARMMLAGLARQGFDSRRKP